MRNATARMSTTAVTVRCGMLRSKAAGIELVAAAIVSGRRSGVIREKAGKAAGEKSATAVRLMAERGEV